jgi:hypothetical protein
MMRAYTKDFYQYATIASENSARIISTMLTEILGVCSVADFGCSEGAWLAAWKTAGVDEIRGIDGPWVDVARLLISPDEFLSTELTNPIDLDGRTFDLVQSLEVGEHLPAAGAAAFIDNLVRHGTKILFSASPPGQGGENHVNERDYSYWRDLFAARGYRMFDPVRPLIRSNPDVQSWYRYNAFLYIRDDAVDTVSSAVQATEIPPHAPIPDISPPLYRARKAIVRRLPGPLQDTLARWKSVVVARKP